MCVCSWKSGPKDLWIKQADDSCHGSLTVFMVTHLICLWSLPSAFGVRCGSHRVPVKTFYTSYPPMISKPTTEAHSPHLNFSTPNTLQHVVFFGWTPFPSTFSHWFFVTLIRFLSTPCGSLTVGFFLWRLACLQVSTFSSVLLIPLTWWFLQIPPRILTYLEPQTYTSDFSHDISTYMSNTHLKLIMCKGYVFQVPLL